MFDLRGRRVTVMGLGRFGGGVGVTRWLVQRGARVLVTDAKPAGQLVEPLEDLRDLLSGGNVTLRLGGHDEADFTGADLVVANPAVPRPWSDPWLEAARRAGVPVTSEIVLCVQRLHELGWQRRCVGITGSVGKSTTSAMIAEGLRRAGLRARLGGNLGGSLLGELEHAAPDAPDWVVLELSSAMLHWISRHLAWSPRVAVVTNLRENHLDWHGTFEHYAQSKRHLVRHQREDDTAVLGPGLESWAGRQRVICTGGRRLGQRLRVAGAHNQVNALQALEACRSVLAEADPLATRDAVDAAVLGALREFAGLPHRLQWVGCFDGVHCYNDSKSTTPAAAVEAVAALREGADPPPRVHLIAGGYDKHIDLTPLADLAPALASLRCIGSTGPALAALARQRHPGTPVHECGTLEAAVDQAWSEGALREGDLLLLSPGCASWDQFPNYEARGNLFIQLVRRRRATSPELPR
jgi:UDP-N-acetylmuramoylalanine--D-glutamate ligase